MIFLLLLTLACTDQSVAKNWGGTAETNLPCGTQLVNVTWKDDNIWYLTKSAPEGYIPKVYTFKEESSFDVLEGTVLIRETSCTAEKGGLR